MFRSQLHRKLGRVRVVLTKLRWDKSIALDYRFDVHLCCVKFPSSRSMSFNRFSVTSLDNGARFPDPRSPHISFFVQVNAGIHCFFTAYFCCQLSASLVKEGLPDLQVNGSCLSLCLIVRGMRTLEF